MSARYVIRCGTVSGKGRYATGHYTWAESQTAAFVFTDDPIGDRLRMTAKAWAEGHAHSIRLTGNDCRVVRLRRKDGR